MLDTIYDLWPLAFPVVFLVLLVVMLIRQRTVDKKFNEAMRSIDEWTPLDFVMEQSIDATKRMLGALPPSLDMPVFDLEWADDAQPVPDMPVFDLEWTDGIMAHEEKN